VSELAVERAEHPAVGAWATMRPRSKVGHVVVETLQKRRKGAVYRLIGAGPSRSDVVAKRSSPERIMRESFAYDKVLPALSVAGVRYYGTLADSEGEDWWLFMSYAGRENYSSHLAQHRALAARWLAALHTSSTGLPPARVPDRGPGYYLGQLERGRDEILDHLANPALTPRDVALLEAIVRQCEILASRWDEVERICDLTSRVFVHGDFAPKNVRVAGNEVPRLLAFDWANGGWGVPAVDLPQMDLAPSTYWANPDLDVYLASVASYWPELTRRDLSAMAAVGKVLRSVVCIRLEAVGLATDWPEAALGDMTYYRGDLEDALHKLQWDL
jgi:hypothetical protein